jgi:hypothetical protein
MFEMNYFKYQMFVRFFFSTKEINVRAPVTSAILSALFKEQ